MPVNIWAWSFLCWKVLNYKFSFFNSYRTGFFSFFFLFFLVIAVFLESLSDFCLLIIGLFYLSWFIGIELFAVFFYYPFILYRICCDSSSFIPNIGNFCLLSVFLVNMARGLSILLIFFQRTSFWFHWFSLLIFCFQIYWFFSLMFIT